MNDRSICVSFTICVTVNGWLGSRSVRPWPCCSKAIT
jgi:hypothetical protein